eukprot:2993593-Rhodomonas_salina.2
MLAEPTLNLEGHAQPGGSRAQRPQRPRISEAHLKMGVMWGGAGTERRGALRRPSPPHPPHPRP